ncbi:hypothetical protein AB0M39_01635 [Streptomyces sp. NPDC051907]|uniref:hypothetical protein n=1 Tax=Streptomyces sp. NPDC051907 TaxID=3155284 RepID=UPI003448E21F
MDMGQPQAGVGRQIFEGLISFLPDWLEIPLLCLLVLIVVGGWIRSLTRKVSARRAARVAPPLAAPPSGGASGADFLGPYAPQQPQAPAPSGADYLGAYAPQPRQEPDSR